MENSGIKELEQLLPEDWEGKAKELKALQRQRNIRTAEELLHMNLLYVGMGGSYQATSEMMTLGAGIHMDKNAVYRRIQASGPWLQYLGKGVCEKTGTLMPKPSFLRDRCVLVVDGSELPVAGSKGGDYHLHYAFDLFGFTCRDMEVTTIRQGEKLGLHNIQKGDIVEGDRVYGTISGMEYVRSKEADFILRLRRNAFILYDQTLQPQDLLSHLTGMGTHQIREFQWHYRVGQEYKPVRIIVMKNDEVAIAKAKRRLKRNASKKQTKPVAEQTALMNEYLVLATSLDFAAEQIIELYRARWQIEMVFLRLKGLLGMGDIPNKKPESVLAWFYGKLLLAALCEAQVRQISFFPPASGFSSAQPLE